VRRRAGTLLRALGRQCFVLADRLAPDQLTRALDGSYKRKAAEELGAALISEADELRGIRDQLRAMASEDSRRLARDIGAHGGRVTPFTRALRRR
jgi:hypothetical protein